MPRITDILSSVTVELDEGLVWEDEFSWSPLQTDYQYTLTGALVIQQGTKQAGRPFTLKGDDSMNWISRASLDTLRGWAAMEGRQLLLQIVGPDSTRSFNVMFNLKDNPIESKPVLGHPALRDNEYFNVVLRFLEVPV